jgi:hypothetical protein
MTVDDKGLNKTLNDVAQQRLSTLKHMLELNKSLLTHEEQFLVVYMLLRSSEPLEKLTKWLKGLTVLLAVLTALLVAGRNGDSVDHRITRPCRLHADFVTLRTVVSRYRPLEPALVRQG